MTADRAGGSVAAVEAVLAEHRLKWAGITALFSCSCGGSSMIPSRDYRRHVAEALAAANLLAAPAGEVERLSEDERDDLHRAVVLDAVGLDHSRVFAAVEHILTARTAAIPAGNEAAADGLRALDDLSYDERVAVDRFMDDHMYHHRHVGPAYAMGCGVECRTDALAEAFRREVLVPRRAALAARTADAQVAAMREVADTAARALLDP